MGSTIFAIRPIEWSRGKRRSTAPDQVAVIRQLDETGFAHQRMGAAGRNRWARRDLVRGIGVDPGAGGPDLTVWPGRPALLGDR